jgi:hypothetical protein
VALALLCVVGQLVEVLAVELVALGFYRIQLAL